MSPVWRTGIPALNSLGCIPMACEKKLEFMNQIHSLRTLENKPSQSSQPKASPRICTELEGEECQSIEFVMYPELKSKPKSKKMGDIINETDGLPKRYICIVCSKVCSGLGQLKLHMIEHSAPGGLGCSEFGKVFKSHIQYHRKQFQCKICSRHFAHNYLLTAHLENEHSDQLKRMETAKNDQASPSDNERLVDSAVQSIGVDRDNVSYKHSTNSHHRSELCIEVNNRNNENNNKNVCTATKKHLNFSEQLDMQGNVNIRPKKYLNCISTSSEADKFERHIEKQYNVSNTTIVLTKQGTCTKQESVKIKHTCAICSKILFGRGEFKLHLSEHASPQLLICPECGKKMNSYSLFSVHIKRHMKDFHCKHCNSRFTNKYLLTRHVAKEHVKISLGEIENLKPYLCSDCGRGFSSKGRLQNHLRIHNNLLKSYMCSVCGTFFATKFTLDGHLRVHSGEKPYKCEMCDKLFRQSKDLVEHKRRAHTTVRPYVCIVCGKRFINATLLKYHTRTHTGESPLTCNICLKTFKNPTYFNVHIKCHSDEKRFGCIVCQSKFKTNGALQRHRKIHSEPGRHVCKMCDKGFNQLGNLKTHMRTHTRERPFQCSVCGLSFPHHGTWKKHFEAHQLN